MATVRMIQQMSGPRPDGRQWPPVGALFEVDEEEARALCHSASQQSHPIAVRVKDEEHAIPAREEHTETGDEDTRNLETAAPRPVRQMRPDPRPARPAAEKRG